ncbi:19100_t:CDS:1, partial [Funneliformis geosporum]
KTARSFGLDEQNAGAYSVFFRENSALKKELKYYHSQHNTLERRVKGLERDVESLKDELEDLDECVDRETV